MAQNPATETNPGVTNVADEAFGVGLPRQVNQTNVRLPVSTSPNDVDGDASGNTRPFVVDQEILVSTPASTALRNRRGDDGTEVKRVSVDQPVTVTTPGPAVSATAGGNFAPGNGSVVTPTQNSTAGQVFGGGGLPREVFV